MYGQLDVGTIQLAATKWVFAVRKKEVRATDPKITEPKSRYFIHCLQHWVVKRICITKTRYKKYSKKDLEQDTLLIDNCGQQYRIHVSCGIPLDMGVKYFQIQPDPALKPLTTAQIEAVKTVKPTYKKDEEGLPFLESQVAQWSAAVCKAIAEAVPDAAPVALDTFPEAVGLMPMNPTIEEPEVTERIQLHPFLIWQLQQAYIHMHYSDDAEEKDAARLLLSATVKRILTSREHHVRIAVMNRAQLARKITKYYDIDFPPAAETTMLPYMPPPFSERLPIHVQQTTFPLGPLPRD